VKKLIQEIIVKGSKSTTFHDFTITTNGLNLILSKGHYVLNNVERIKSDIDVTITLDSPTEDTHYEVWLSETGLQVLSRTDSENFDVVNNPIDRLLWFTISANETDLNNTEINFVKVVE
jgi:hypothetical protein